ncbi:insecticidal toxin complex protein TccC [Bacillus thuringiensis]|uniref:Insecticidal toxin complex protein TccC n=1 Tax=Bacillus thuringiensis TaxID=1428 RepID=A0A4R4BEF2_BACTU|nr:RHS repeat-associated core domain-containing protein [Bacillus thuringiensis]TCW52921.1 insecticidal toxin complex protein TccC [Bacillus thuringiensis]TCW53091.1 insecticidal toxin complex protein TccC [Bacillus thuringiensis]
MNTTSIYSGTPTISVIDNRGLQVRTLEYNRVIDGDPIDEYITGNTYTLLGNLDSSMDPRLFSQYQNNSSILPNMRYSTSLKDNVLCTESVDAGRKTQLFDIEGRLTWFMDANHTQTTMEYDVIGRPIAVLEKQEGIGIPKYRERFIYGESEIDAQANNLCGQLVRHYDTAGRSEIKSFSIFGMPLYQSRQLLKNIDQPSNWSVDGESTWIDFLDADTYDTSWQYDVQGKKAAQIDAKGNLQRVTYNVVGQPKAVSLTLQGQTEQSIANWIEYNAAGQVQRTEAGNGILTEYIYEESTQRLMRKKDSRELSSGKREVLQVYCYEYDPVGNILSISNESDTVRIYRNQVIVPKRQYTYDALYQLVSSSGREADSFRQQQSFPSLITPIPLDDSQYVNYFEKYNYDRAGNLIKLSHKGASQYTTDISIDDTSNRGIWKRENETPNIIDTFDKAGNQNFLLPGIPMEWDTRNQLCRVNMVVREEEANDRENYIYDGLGMRLVKRYIRKTKNTTQTDTTVYLPGLELRKRQTGENVTELLHVVTVDTEIVQVKILHWEDGTQPNGIENDQYRYSISDHLGSSMLELDRQGQIISKEEFYPYGGTALWAARTEVEANYKTIRYSGKELDATGLYYYGYRYYMPWLGRWLNPDPAGTVDGMNLYRMVGNNPINSIDEMGLQEKPNVFTLTSSDVTEIETQTDLSNMKINLSSIKMDNTDAKWNDIRENFDDIATKLVKIAVNYENAYKKQIEGYSKKQSEKAMKAFGPAVAVAYNLNSKKYHVAINQSSGKLPEKMDARIEDLVPDQMPEVVRNIYREKTKGAGSHAEVYASNSALLDNSNTKPEDLIVYVNRVNSRAKEPAEIRPFITCPDCGYVLGGWDALVTLPGVLEGLKAPEVSEGPASLLNPENLIGLIALIPEDLNIKMISNNTEYWKSKSINNNYGREMAA